MGRSAKSVIKVPSEIKYLRKVSSEILDSLASRNLDESVLFDIRLCVEEAVRNAMVHGNRGDKKLMVQVSYVVESGKLNIDVEDCGHGFDYDRVPDPVCKDNILKTSGRGVLLIRRLMDSATYNKAGNKLSMVKALGR